MNTLNKSHAVKFNALVFALLLCGTAGAQNIEIPTFNIKQDSGTPTQLPLTPLLVLSENVGDVGKEAISVGVPKISDVNQFSKYVNGIMYVDVDSISEPNQRRILDMVKAALKKGQMAVIETSEFNFGKMHNIVKSEFPMIDPATIEDVALLLRMDAGAIKAMRIDPSELAMYSGVDFQNTTAGRFQLPVEPQSNSKTLPPYSAKLALDLAIKAYAPTPSAATYNLAYNGTYVDVWKENNRLTPGVPCYVAWRGTNIKDGEDVWRDVSSQFHKTIEIPNAEGEMLKGGKGFVVRLSDYVSTVNQTLRDSGCTIIHTTGHSLGAAVSQLHGANLAFNADFKNKLGFVYGWNSPNVIDSDSRAIIRARFSNLDVKTRIANRKNDVIVNSVPTGLKRLGPSNSPLDDVDYIGERQSINPFGNHSPDFWYEDISE